MVIDSSVLLAILFDEPGAADFELAIEKDPVRLVSAGSLLEAGLVVEARLAEAGARELDLLMYKARIEIVAVDEAQVEVGRRGFRRFGKGRHPAALNFGDCFAYALSKTSGEPLLFKGEDFSKSDVTPVV